MCRLFGMSSVPERTNATFWLLDAPDNLRDQSRRNPEGVGLGWFETDGTPHVYKAPIAGFEDRSFAVEAKSVESAVFLAHVRYASTGKLVRRNTHPFEQDGRLFAHNGVVEDLPRLEAHLGADMQLVRGDTDSERFFALITRETAAHGGDVGAGIAAACRWISAELPLYSLNMILTTPTDMWALRYPRTHGLYVLERPAGGLHGDRHLDHAGRRGRMRVHSHDLVDVAAVVVASERMDDSPGWRELASGELLHVDRNLKVTSTPLLPEPPAHLLTLQDLHPDAAASQQSS